MLTPKKYWRVARTLEELERPPDDRLPLPQNLAKQTTPPKVGDGILLADYDATSQTGLIRYLGVVVERVGDDAKVDWRPTKSQIWVDTGAGRGFWQQPGGFGFAAAKIAGYGLHQLYAEHFEDMTVREGLASGSTVVSGGPLRPTRTRSGAIRSPERTTPEKVVGEPSSAERGGYVYVLKSALGFKVGRTRNVGQRMNLFAVKMPFIYSIPLCAWFDDHYEAETNYHRLFANKNINGEWFSLTEADVEMVRQRTFR